MLMLLISPFLETQQAEVHTPASSGLNGPRKQTYPSQSFLLPALARVWLPQLSHDPRLADPLSKGTHMKGWIRKEASPAPLTARILQVRILSLVLHSCSHLGRKFALGSVLGSWDASPWRCALGSSLVGKQGGNRDHEEVITVCSEAWEGEEGQRRAGEVSGTYPVCHPPCPLPSTSHGGSGLLPRLL